MRFLVLSPIFPNAPSDGDRLRLYHLMRGLSKKHRLSLACFTDPARREDSDMRAMKNIAEQIHQVPMPRAMQWIHAGLSYASSLPSNVAAYSNQEMRFRVDDLLSKQPFDAVFCYRLRMVPYALRARLPRVMDYTDCLTRYYERRAIQAKGIKARIWRREAEKIAAYEAWASWQFDACFMNSEADAATLRAMAPGAKVLTVANGVDFETLKPGRLKRDPDCIVFNGNLAYPPNAEAVLWFVREIFPKIRKRRPRARFVIVGGHASAPIRALGSVVGVELKGFVEDFKPLLCSAGVSVCPVRLAAGRQNKILDAFATGTPVVATSLTASGCEAVAGLHLSVADQAEDFAAETLRLMENPSLGRRLAGNALKFVKFRYDWSKSAALVEAAIRRHL